MNATRFLDLPKDVMYIIGSHLSKRSCNKLASTCQELVYLYQHPTRLTIRNTCNERDGTQRELNAMLEMFPKLLKHLRFSNCSASFRALTLIHPIRTAQMAHVETIEFAYENIFVVEENAAISTLFPSTRCLIFRHVYFAHNTVTSIFRSFPLVHTAIFENCCFCGIERVSMIKHITLLQWNVVELISRLYTHNSAVHDPINCIHAPNLETLCCDRLEDGEISLLCNSFPQIHTITIQKSLSTCSERTISIVTPKHL